MREMDLLLALAEAAARKEEVEEGRQDGVVVGACAALLIFTLASCVYFAA